MAADLKDSPKETCGDGFDHPDTVGRASDLTSSASDTLDGIRPTEDMP